jgi:hypothetical protein
MIKEDAILKIYPDARPNIDFVIVTDPETLETEIAAWEYQGTKPTAEQLQAAWDELQRNPPPAPLSLEQLQKEQELIKAALDDVIFSGGML